MASYELELAEERDRLARVLAVARAQLDAVSEGDARGRAEMERERLEMHEQAEQMFLDLWSADSFEALANLNQFAHSAAVSQSTREVRLARMRALENMLNAPYFARVDMAFHDGDDDERIYVGRSTLKDEASRETLIYDWRSPIASVFYRFGVGQAHYDAPGGRVECDVTRKRQFEIRRGALEYFFDADVQVQDRFLRAMLAKNASPQMKAIVETIQRDQDLAIRDAEHDLLMVQGAAGSGKSSIAMHRVAYLMYEGLTSPLSAGEILILSPNALFERYIRGVLPELGERNVATGTLEEMVSRTLGGVRVETRTERFERLCLSGDAPILRDAMAFLSSPVMIEVIRRFVRNMPRSIPFEDVCYGGRTVATRQMLKARMLRTDRAPLGVRLRRLEMRLWSDIHEHRQARMAKLTEYARRRPNHALEVEACARAYSILECTALTRRIRRFTHLDARALYRRLVSDEAAFKRLARGLALPDNLGAILRFARDSVEGVALTLECAVVIAYLRLTLEGPRVRGDVKQVVVDEAQDLDAMSFAVLGQLFPYARFTVLGDVNQALDRRADRGLYDQISGILNRRSAALVELDKSFRCTAQILRFSLRFLEAPGGIHSFNRSGEEPGEHFTRDAGEAVRLIAEEIALCREKGMRSIALITRTVRDARAWRERLKEHGVVGLIDSEDADEPGGAFLIPLALSKGLEFDAVLVLDVERYGASEKRLLYVACTRALHRLNLYAVGVREGGECE